MNLQDRERKTCRTHKRKTANAVSQREMVILLTEFGRLASLREIGLMLPGISVVYQECPIERHA